MSLNKFLLIFFLIFGSNSHSAPIVELEHSLVTQNNGGSSWGTDGLLVEELQKIDEASLPDIFKQKIIQKNSNFWLKLTNSSAKKYYLNSEVYLFKQLNICFHKSIHFNTQPFFISVESFESQLFAPQDGVDQKKFTFSSFDRLEQTSSCDVLVLQGKSDDFPFKNILPYEKQGEDFPQIVLGLYYQKSKDYKPVIVFHPNLNLDFSDNHASYLEGSPAVNQNKLKVDGRVLFLHELGHVLGLSHIQAQNSKSIHAMTLMGLENIKRHPDEIKFRFFSQQMMWANIDLSQSRTYRALDYLHYSIMKSKVPVVDYGNVINNFNFNVPCVLTGEIITQVLPMPHFVNTPGSSIESVLNILKPVYHFENILISTASSTKIDISPDIFLSVQSLKNNVKPATSFNLLSFSYNKNHVGITQSSLKMKINSTPGYISHKGFIRTNNYLLGYWGSYNYKVVNDLTMCFEK